MKALLCLSDLLLSSAFPGEWGNQAAPLQAPTSAQQPLVPNDSGGRPDPSPAPSPAGAQPRLQHPLRTAPTHQITPRFFKKSLFFAPTLNTKEAVYIFSQSSLEKRSKIGSWQRTRLPPPQPCCSPIWILAFCCWKGSASPPAAPSSTPPALCQLDPGCSVSVQSQQREQTLWVCREIEVCGCCF